MARELKHLFGSVRTCPVEAPRGGISTATSVRYEFVSTMRKKMFWRDSRGVVLVECNSVTTTPDEGFYINVEYELTSGSELDPRELLASMELPDSSPIRKELLKRINELSNDQTWRAQRYLKFTMGISAKELDAAGGVVYLRDFDLIVGYDHLREQAMHPFTQPARLESMRQQLDANTMGINLRIIYIDNTHKQHPVWYNHGMGAVEIKPETDPQLEDGFYVFYRRKEGDEFQYRYFSIEEAKKQLGLYINEIEALNFGNPKAVYEAQIRDQEHQLVMLKQENVQIEQRNKQWKLEMEQERDALRYEREQQTEELRLQRERDDERRKRQTQEWEEEQRRQQHQFDMQKEGWRIERERYENQRNDWRSQRDYEYEMRKSDRKDQADAYKTTMEIIKVVLSLVGPAIALYAAMNKGKDK